MIENAYFKPNVGVLSKTTNEVLYPKAFGIGGEGVYDYKTGKLLFTEEELRNDPLSGLPEEDNNPFNQLQNLFKGGNPGVGSSVVSDRPEKAPYRRSTVRLTTQETKVDKNIYPEDVNDKVGLLIQPYTYIQWGGVSVKPQWFRDLAFEWGEDETPGGLTMTLDPMAPFAELPIGEEDQGAEILVEIGYTDKRKMTLNLIHTGTTIDSGNSMRVGVEFSHNSFLADQTPERNRYFVGKDSPIKVMDNFKDVLDPYGLVIDDSAVKGFGFDFQFSSQAETDMCYLLRMCQNYGLTVDYGYNGEADIVLKPKDTTKREKPKPADEEGEPEAKDSYVYYLGPGLIDTITRKIVAQKLSSPPPDDKTATDSNAIVDLKKKATAKDPLKFITQSIGQFAAGSIPNTNLANTKKIKNKREGDPVGPAADANKPVSSNESKDATEKDTDQDKEIQENKEAGLEQGQIEMTTSFIMVPRVVGIKPSDMVVISWMNDGDEEYQDFLVKSVSYSQEGANYRVSITATRWLKEESMMENWDEIKADMEKRGLVGEKAGAGIAHSNYPMFRNWTTYYWGN